MRVTQTCRMFFTLMLVLASSMAMAEPNAVAAEKADILSMMPDNSLAFVVVNDPAMLVRKAGMLAKRLEVPMPDPMPLLQEKLPAAKHLDMARPAAVAIHPGGTPVGGVILLPVTDFEAFVKACGAEDASADLVKVKFGGDDVLAASHNGYALLTDASDAAVVQAVKNNDGKIAKEFAAMRQRMEAGDISGGVTRSGIGMFAALAKRGIAALQAEILKRNTDEMPGMPPKSIAEALSVYTVPIDEFDAAVESYGFTISLKKQAIVGQDIIRLKPGEFATSLGQIEPSDTDWAGKLPAGRLVGVMAGSTPKPLMEAMLGMSKKMMTMMSGIYGMDEDQIEQLFEDSKPLMEKTRGMAFVMGVPRNGDASLYAGAGGILKVDGNAEQYIDDYAKLVTKMVRAMKGSPDEAMLHFTPPKKIEIDGKPGLRIVVDIDISLGAKDSEQQQMFDEMMAKMYGPDGKMTIFMAAANKDTVAFGYTSQATVKRFMAAANGKLPRTLGSMPAYKAVLAHLPTDAQWGGGIDLGGYFELIRRFVPQGMIPDVDIPPSPIGFGVTASEQEVCVHSVVTVNTIKRLVQAIQKMASASAGRQPVELEAVPSPPDDVMLDQ